MKKQRPLSMQFWAQFKVDLKNPPTLEDDLDAMFRLRQHLRQLSSKLTDWFLGGNSREEALLYSAFDERGPTVELVSILKKKSDKNKDKLPISHSFGFWNGREGTDGASMGLSAIQAKGPSFVRFDLKIPEFLTYPNALSTTKKMVEIWKPLYISVAQVFYDRVFKDRPGVGWMLSLPRVLSVEQVPEARALVPVMSKDAQGKEAQTGTIIVINPAI
jgi:hypothetical protein